MAVILTCGFVLYQDLAVANRKRTVQAANVCLPAAKAQSESGEPSQRDAKTQATDVSPRPASRASAVSPTQSDAGAAFGVLDENSARLSKLAGESSSLRNEVTELQRDVSATSNRTGLVSDAVDAAKREMAESSAIQASRIAVLQQKIDILTQAQEQLRNDTSDLRKSVTATSSVADQVLKSLTALAAAIGEARQKQAVLERDLCDPSWLADRSEKLKRRLHNRPADTK